MDAENAGVFDDVANHNQAVEMEDVNVVDADNNVNAEANQDVAIQADDAHEMALADDHDMEDDGSGESAVEDDDEDEAGDVIMDENENAADENDEASGSGNIGIADVWQQFCVNKPVLWDLEAPSLGYHFEKFLLAEADRDVVISYDIDEFQELMENVTNVDLMSHLPNEEAQARVKERLELFQQRKIKYQDLQEHMHGASNDFSKCVERLDIEWNKGRLDRALVNHLLRMRYIDTAYNFALKREIQDLFDFKKFREADLIVEALKNKDLHPAKAWSNTNAAWSDLGIEIYIQEYIEIVRTNQNMKAIEFAWNHQEALSEVDVIRVRQVLAVAAFGRDTSVLRYKKLFDDERWDFLIDLFWKKFLKKQWFTDDASSLCILLESGITALKVPFCFDGDDCKKVDPLKHEPFRTFASILPHARHAFPPKLLCHVTKQPLGQQNPPYMLPNGYAYSKQAILGMKNGDEVTCPRTGFVCKTSDLRKLNLVGYP